MSYKLTEAETESIEEAFLVSYSQIDRHTLINTIIARKVAEALESVSSEVDDEELRNELLAQTQAYRAASEVAFTGRR